MLFRSAIIQSTEYDAQSAEELLELDDKIDRKFKAARTELVEMMSVNPDDARQLLRCSEIFHALEHIADQAVYILKTLKMHRLESS